MAHRIALLLLPLLRRLFPSTGRHRSLNSPPTAPSWEDAPTLTPPPPRTLCLAVHGVDIGPRRVHGVEVAA